MLRPDPSRRQRRTLVLCALTAALAVPASAQLDPTVYPAGAVRGEQALDFIGADLARVAEEHFLTANELTLRLRTDPTVYVTAEKRLFVVDEAAPARGFDDDVATYAGTSIPLEDAFELHSNPGAEKTIYMDFTGHHSVSNSWNHNINFPAYNTSGSSSTFSNGELQDVIDWWLRVVEDFVVFDNVNVTTEEPPLSDLTRNGGGDNRYGMRCVITQPTSGFGNGIGGVALLNSFNDSIDNPCFAFNKGDNTGSMTVSHEVGHTFGLQHDGLNGSTYHPGTGSGETSWGPIMGAPFGANLVQWSNGDYSGATSGQNDYSIMQNSSNDMDLAADDHGDDENDASPFLPATGCPVPSPSSAQGVIERRADVDAFEFSTSGGEVTITALPYEPGPNLDIRLDLLNGAGQNIGTSNPANQIDASLTVNLAAGTYYVLIDGTELSGTYSDYGSRGRYTVTLDDGSGGGEPSTDLGGAIPTLFSLLPTLTFSGLACGGEDFTLTLSTAGPNHPAFLLLGLTSLGVPFKGGTLWPDFGTGGLFAGFNTGFLGAILISDTWPVGIPVGTEIFVQFWMQDNAGPAGYTASNGLRIVQP